MRSFSARMGLLTGIALCILCMVSQTPHAKANVIDRVQDIFRLPGDVDKLQKDYERMRKEYDNTAKELEQAKEAAKRYEQKQEQLIQENSALQRQNAELTSMVGRLEKSERDRTAYMRQIRNVAVTAIILVLVYFISARLIRVALRSRG
jgi:septal ring factor EnvC (AmiA/AmiB activator)